MAALLRTAPADMGKGQESFQDSVRTTAIADRSGVHKTLTAASKVFSLRILHVIHRLGSGGMEYGVLKLLAGLDSHRFQQQICTLCGAEDALAGLQLVAGRLLSSERVDGRQNFAVPRLLSIMRSCRPHIVHSRNWGAIEAVAAAKLARVPVVIHSEHGYELGMLGGLPLRQRLARRFLYAMADTIFTVSEDLQQYHSRQAWRRAEEIRVLRNGVDTDRFAPSMQIRHTQRQKLALEDDVFTIGCVGRMIPLKDHKTLLRAAEILCLRGVNLRVVLVGTGPELDAHQHYVRSSAALSRRVSFCAPDAIPKVLNAMDVFVQPSICEGMSNTVLEAMATGLPILATRVGGNPELVEDGCAGWLFQPGDIQTLASRLEQLAEDRRLRCEFGLAARRIAVERYGLQQMLDQYSHLYLECARRRSLVP